MMKLINELGKLGNCFDLCSTISHYVTNRREYKEVEETIFLTRSILSNFMKKSPSDNEFNFFISEIEASLDRLCTLYTNKVNQDTKIDIFEVDYLLKQQMEQLNFEYVNCNDISPIALIEDIFAKKFWLESFGKERLVEKGKFIEEMCKVLDAELSDKETEQLEYYLDFTEDGYISVFEFQKLLLNFGPFRKLASNLKELSQHDLAIFKISSKRANSLLEKKKAGDYLLRFSKSQSNSFAITYIDQKNTVKNSLIINTRDGIKTTSSNTIYSSLPKFLAVHNCILKSCESLTISLIRSLTQKITVPLLPLQDDLPALDSCGSSPSSSYSPSSCLSSAKEEDDKDAQISNVCVSCLKSQRDSVMDCKHFVCCFSCSSSLKACPICHAPNNNPIQIYVC